MMVVLGCWCTSCAAVTQQHFGLDSPVGRTRLVVFCAPPPVLCSPLHPLPPGWAPSCSPRRSARRSEDSQVGGYTREQNETSLPASLVGQTSDSYAPPSRLTGPGAMLTTREEANPNLALCPGQQPASLQAALPQVASPVIPLPQSYSQSAVRGSPSPRLPKHPPCSARSNPAALQAWCCSTDISWSLRRSLLLLTSRLLRQLRRRARWSFPDALCAPSRGDVARLLYPDSLATAGVVQMRKNSMCQSTCHGRASGGIQPRKAGMVGRQGKQSGKGRQAGTSSASP